MFVFTLHETVDRRGPVVALFDHMPTRAGLEAAIVPKLARLTPHTIVTPARLTSVLDALQLDQRGLARVPELLARDRATGGPEWRSANFEGLVVTWRELDEHGGSR